MDKAKLKEATLWLRENLTLEEKAFLRTELEKRPTEWDKWPNDKGNRLGITLRNKLRANGFSERECAISDWQQKHTEEMSLFSFVLWHLCCK